jgi:restriction system protein
MPSKSEKVSEIPTPPGFFEPLLKLLAASKDGTMRRRDLLWATADQLGLSDAQRQETLPAAPTPRFIHRAGWGLNMLKAGGYVVRTETRGEWTIHARGRELLAAHPQGFSPAIVKQLIAESRGDTPDEEEVPDLGAVVSPEERIEKAVEELHREMRKDLLARLGAASPRFFEDLVLDVLRALGYGQDDDSFKHVGRTNDGGIDGIVALDKLGFDKICVQAKRWQGNVGASVVRDFCGALHGKRARKGLLVTTAAYTREAEQFAASVADTLVLIDGQRLAQLMIDHQVGVTHRKKVAIPEIDGDRFAED